jgi:hypothetical protein
VPRIAMWLSVGSPNAERVHRVVARPDRDKLATWGAEIHDLLARAPFTWLLA